jgi:glucose/arabinose dehydrogenase
MKLSLYGILIIAANVTLPLAAQQTVTGQAAFAGYTQQKPGVRRKITVADLPEPNLSESVDNGPTQVKRPDRAWPIAPPGFKVQLYAGGDAATPMQRSENKEETHRPTSGTFVMPRILRTAPNGDLFVADSQAGSILVLRGVTPTGKAATISTYAIGLDHPFGIAFYPSGAQPLWMYVGNATTVIRFPYKPGALKATGAPQIIVPDIPGYAQLRGGGHWTRDVVFSADGKHMLVSVGSGSNVDDPDTHPSEFHRADVLEYTPEGNFVEVYASGIRNCVGEAINPTTGELWCSTKPCRLASSKASAAPLGAKIRSGSFS